MAKVCHESNIAGHFGQAKTIDLGTRNLHCVMGVVIFYEKANILRQLIDNSENTSRETNVKL